MALKPIMIDYIRDEIVVVLTAMAGGALRYAKTCQTERFSVATLIIGLASSGFIGYVSYGICDIFGVSSVARSAVAAMCGYSGSALLDALHAGLLDSVGRMFDAIAKKLSGKSTRHED